MRIRINCHLIIKIFNQDCAAKKTNIILEGVSNDYDFPIDPSTRVADVNTAVVVVLLFYVFCELERVHVVEETDIVLEDA